MRRRPKGQGLLELIIAIGIIMASVITTLGLVLSTSRTSDVSKARILAANLAREGIEVARSVRDNNWLAIDSGIIPNTNWNNGLSQGASPNADYTAIASFQPPSGPPPQSGGTWTFLFNEDVIGEPKTEMYLHPTKGIYTQLENTIETQNCPDGPFCDFQAINYWRLVSLFPVCWQNDGPGSEQVVSDGRDCATAYPGYEQVGIQVHSRVRWLERGRPQNIELVEKIFNWKS